FIKYVGLNIMNRLKTKNEILTTRLNLIILGFVPKIAAFTTIIPTSVLGGAMVAMFGMVIAQGIKMLSKVISASPENAMIVACSIGMGLGVTVVPEIFAKLPDSIQILTSNGIVAGSVTAIVLNILFNVIPAKKKTYTEETLIEQEV